MTHGSWIAILVMLNNFFHDLAVAMFLCALLGMSAVAREAARETTDGLQAALDRLRRTFRRTAGWSLALIVVFGVVRTIAYRDFEWSDAAGRGQVAALVVKHVAFLLLIGAGVVHVWRRRHGGTRTR